MNLVDMIYGIAEKTANLEGINPEIDKALEPLRSERLQVGITHYDLAVISAYLVDNGSYSDFTVPDVAKSLGLNEASVRTAFNRFAEIGLVEVKDEVYKMDKWTRLELKRRSSTILPHSTAFLANKPELYGKIQGWVLTRPYKVQQTQEAKATSGGGLL